MRNRNTPEYLGIWERLFNPNFKPTEFKEFRTEAGLNAFTMSPKKWIEGVNAIGVICIEDLAGGEGFVALDKVDDIVRHLIVGTPRHILDIAECGGHYVAVLAEYCGRIDGKCRPRVYAWDILDR